MRILTTLAVKGAIDEMRPALEAAAGGPLELVLEPTAVMLKRVAAGERGDVALLTASGIDRLIADGYLSRVPRADMFRSLVGLAVGHGAPRPDISTVAAFVRTLHEAKSICYSRGGASGIFFSALIERLGVADIVNAKATIIASGFTAEVVARGEAEMAVQQVSELMTVPGVDIVGAFPEGVQESLLFSGAVFATSPHRAAAERILGILTAPANAAIFTRNGLLPVTEAS